MSLLLAKQTVMRKFTSEIGRLDRHTAPYHEQTGNLLEICRTRDMRHDNRPDKCSTKNELLTSKSGSARICRFYIPFLNILEEIFLLQQWEDFLTRFP